VLSAQTDSRPMPLAVASSPRGGGTQLFRFDQIIKPTQQRGGCIDVAKAKLAVF